MGGARRTEPGIPPALRPDVGIVLVHIYCGLLSSLQEGEAAVCYSVVPRTEASEDAGCDVKNSVSSTRLVSIVIAGDEPLVRDCGVGGVPLKLVGADSKDRYVIYYLGDGVG